MKTVDIVIVGGGPAGLAAAVAAKEAGNDSILILERDHEDEHDYIEKDDPEHSR